MISSTAINKTAGYWNSIISHGMVTIAGAAKRFEIYKTVLSGNVLTKYLYLDNTDVGTVSRVQLIDTVGAVFAEQPDSVVKSGRKGLLIAFRFTITEV